MGLALTLEFDALGAGI